MGHGLRVGSALVLLLATTCGCLAKADADIGALQPATPAPAAGNAAAVGTAGPHDTSFTGPNAIALAGSDVDRVGQAILARVAGRTLDQAMASGAPKENPFGLEADQLLVAAGVYFINGDDSKVPLSQSEFAIYPDYVTPAARFVPSDKTPPIMPFAFNRGGICHGGYVTGYPVPDKVFAVDMHGKPCSARTVDEAARAAYDRIADELPANSDAAVTGGVSNALFDGTAASDHDLEMIAYGAYTGAYNQARKHGNFFRSDDLSFADLRTSIRDALEKEGYGATDVVDAPVADAHAAKTCATGGRVELRIAFNSAGQGVSLVAVSGRRMSAYEYVPGSSTDLSIVHATDCLAPGSGAAPPPTAQPDRLSTPAH